MTTKPGLMGASKTPRKNLPAASPGKLVAAPVQASTTPATCKFWFEDKKGWLTPEYEVDGQEFSSGELLHEIIGRILGDQVPKVEERDQHTVLGPLEICLLYKTIRSCGTKSLSELVATLGEEKASYILINQLDAVYNDEDRR